MSGAVSRWTMTRRDVLTSLLGVPLALEACRKPPPPSIAGSIRGPSMHIGHRLRDAPLDASGAPEVRVPILIVGAGASGLSAAWRLDRLGERRFAVLDLEPRAGGTSTYDDDGVVPYPWGAHYVPAPRRDNRALLALLGEMGAVEGTGPDGEPQFAEEQLVRAPEERLFYGGRWYDGLYLRAGASSQDLVEHERFRREIDGWVSKRDGKERRAFDLPLEKSSTDPDITVLDRISMRDWLEQRRFTSSRLLWWVDYACRDDYGLSIADTSAWAGLFYFASRIRAAGDEPADLLAWPHGNGRIIEHLAGAAGERLETHALVTDIAPREASVDVTVLQTSPERVVRYVAEHVIFALPKFMARRILRPFRDGAPPHLSAFQYGAWMVANIHLRRRPGSRGVPAAWDNVLYDSPSLGYVVATHQRGLDHGPTIWTYYHPMTDADAQRGREKLLALDHAAFCDLVVADLERAHIGFRDAIERIDVFRWAHAMVRPYPGFMFGGDRTRAAEPYGRVHFAHSDLSGLALFEEAQYRGIRAAEEVLRARGRQVESIL